MKEDEKKLMLELKRLGSRRIIFATDVGVALGMHENRANYILQKWVNIGVWKHGTSIRTGSLTQKGIIEADRIDLDEDETE